VVDEDEENVKQPLARTAAHLEAIQARIAAKEEAEEEDDEEDEYGAEEGEGEEGEGEEAEVDYGEEEPEESLENPRFVPKEDKYFMHGEKLKNKFNEVELDSFMKLLNVKPHRQWEDNSVHHYKLGAHRYEDDSQHLDPHFHLLGEVERKHAEKIMVQDFRRGAEVRFQVGDKKPAHFNYRF